MPAPRWSAAEADYLESLAGNVPPHTIPDAYNAWAKRNSCPTRTRYAIHCKLCRHHLHTRPFGDWITTGYIARITGLSIDTPQRWVARGFLATTKRKPNGIPYIRRADVVTLARDQPQLFAGIPRGPLVQLLEHEALADSILQAFPTRNWGAKPVRCVETGRLYPSTRDAARSHFLTRQAIQCALKTGGTAAGYHWQLAA